MTFRALFIFIFTGFLHGIISFLDYYSLDGIILKSWPKVYPPYIPDRENNMDDYMSFALQNDRLQNRLAEIHDLDRKSNNLFFLFAALLLSLCIILLGGKLGPFSSGWNMFLCGISAPFAYAASFYLYKRSRFFPEEYKITNEELSKEFWHGSNDYPKIYRDRVKTFGYSSEEQQTREAEALFRFDTITTAAARALPEMKARVKCNEIMWVVTLVAYGIVIFVYKFPLI